MATKFLFCMVCFFELVFQSSAAYVNAKVLGQNRIFAFLYLQKGKDPKTLQSANHIHNKPDQWKYWYEKSVIHCRGNTWFSLLRNSVSKDVEILTTIDYGGNPKPVVCIDEFGFNFDGHPIPCF